MNLLLCVGCGHADKNKQQLGLQEFIRHQYDTKNKR